MCAAQVGEISHMTECIRYHVSCAACTIVWHIQHKHKRKHNCNRLYGGMNTTQRFESGGHFTNLLHLFVLLNWAMHFYSKINSKILHQKWTSTMVWHFFAPITRCVFICVGIEMTNSTVWCIVRFFRKGKKYIGVDGALVFIVRAFVNTIHVFALA